MTSKPANHDENRLHSEYEKERALLEYGASLEHANAREQRKHEWRLIVVEKLWITILVLVISVGATVYGNVILERYKDGNSARHAKSEVARQASEEIWKKLRHVERSVDEYDYDIQQIQRDHDVAFFKKDMPSDTSKVYKDAGDLKKEFSDAYNAIDDCSGLIPLDTPIGQTDRRGESWDVKKSARP